MLDTTTPQSGIIDRYGLRRIINASGTETTKGASPVCPEVVAAISELIPNSVDMLELQSVACKTIARVFGTEAGCVVNCTAAGISIAVAACMTGRNLARVERLPDTNGLKHEVILQRGHNITYGGHIFQNVTIVGGKIVEIGAATECGAYQLRDAITPDTVAALYVVSHHTVQSGLIDLATFVTVCHEHGIPVIVDGAAEPDPRIFVNAGADLVISSMHKQFASITGGVVAGRLELVQACIFQEQGIGRPMKVGKEGVIGAIAALERWEALDRDCLREDLDARLHRGKNRLGALPGLAVTIEPDSTSHLFSRLLVDVGRSAGLSAYDLAGALWNQTPSIAVRSLMADIGLLQVDLRRASDDETEYILGSIERIVQEAAARGPREVAVQEPSPNLADLAVASLERWPLPVGQRD